MLAFIKYNKRIKFLLALILVIMYLSFSLAKANNVFIREYSYSASEHDSKVTARQAALQQLQALVIEEVGIQIQSSFSQNTQVDIDKEDFNRQVQSNYASFAQAVTRTKILEEKWDGITFYLKAEIKVDPQELNNKLESLAAQYNANSCEANSAQVDKILDQENSLQKAQNLIKFSMQAPLDNDCNSWQKKVLYFLVHSSTQETDAEYKKYLLEQLNMQPAKATAHYIDSITKYIHKNNVKSVTQKDWGIILASIVKAPSSYLNYYLEGLVYANLMPFYKEGDKQSDKDESLNRLWQQLNYLSDVAALNKLGVPAISQTDFLRLTAKVLRNEKLKIAGEKLEYLWIVQQQEQQKASLPSVFTAEVIGAFIYDSELSLISSKEGEILQMVLAEYSQLTDAEISARNANFSSYSNEFQRLIKALDQTPEGQETLALLSHLHGKQLVRLLTLSGYTQRHDVQKIFVRYNLPNNTVCTPEECAKQLFSQDLNEMLHAADLLQSYGERALPQKNLIVRKLERLLNTAHAHQERNARTYLLSWLIEVDAQDTPTLELLVQGFANRDVNLTAELTTVLQVFHPAPVPLLIESYARADSETQLALVQALGKMPPDTRILKFLQSLTPQTNSLRAAVEDALLFQE